MNNPPQTSPPIWRGAITYGLFPIGFFGSLSAAWVAHRAGVAHAAILVATALAMASLIALVERIHPAYPTWKRDHGDIPTDAVHVLVSQAIIPTLLEATLPALLLGLAGALASATPDGLWPHHWPISAQVLLAIITSQFFEYWFHRWSHTNRWLWRLHATHHSPERLYFLNAARFHPLDTALSVTISLTVLTLSGAREGVLLLVATWVLVHGLFQHCNIHLRLGPLNWVFSMAELHRWHHSRILEEANSNYGNNILLWDIVFGTVYWPSDRDASANIGLEQMPDFPRGYVGQLLSPVTWSETGRDGAPPPIEPRH